MANINVISQVAPYLPYFSSTEQIKLIKKINNFSPNISRANLTMFVKFVELITASTTQADKDIIFELANDIMSAEYNSELPKMFEVYKGEDHCLNITMKDGVDWTGFFLTARNYTDQALLSANNIAGSDAEVQSIQIDDINLSHNKFYKFIYAVENPNGSIASGDVVVVLTAAYFLVKPSVDV
jgi:hypothetical protein